MEQFEFDHTPYYKTLTNAGNSHFNRISDALAEFIDNAIQATSKKEVSNTYREIDVRLYVNEGYIAILDNGCGMNIDDMKSFATYSYDQESRNQAPSEGDRSFISKFGVGAKEAGFYLGHRMRVISKKIFSEEPNYVLDYLMDEDVYKRRQLEGQQVFIGTTVRRQMTDLSHISNMDEKRIIQSLSPSGTHFTMIIICLRDVIKDKLVKSCEHIPPELAEIYRFQLKPELLPNNVISSPNFQVERTISGQKFQLPKLIQANSSKSCTSPLNISVSFPNSGGDSIAIRDELRDDLCSAAAAFRFDLRIPDPNPYKEVETANTQYRAAMSQLTSNLQTNANAPLRTMQGLLFYYPFVNGTETRPRTVLPVTNSNGGVTSSSGKVTTYTQGSSGHDEKSDAGMTEDNNSEDDATFAVYWQDRLLPQSTVDRLHFFPSAMDALKCAALNIPTKWKSRIKGYLFLDWDFRHISNNKLKVVVDPDFNTWLNDTNRAKLIVSIPKFLDSSFPVWLRHCHTLFDRERRFERRDIMMEKEYLFKNNKHVSIFKRVVIECEGAEHSIEADERIYKLSMPGKGKVGAKNEVFGKIFAFSVPASLPADQTVYYGPANIIYIRYPTEVFGADVQIMSCTDALSVFETHNFKEITAKPEELKRMKSLGPSRIRVVGLLNAGTADPVQHDLALYRRISITDTFYRIGIQILNGNGDAIITRPISTEKYKVEMTLFKIRNNIKTQIDKHTLSTNDLYIFDHGIGDDRKTAAKKELPYAYYSVYNVSFTKIGNYAIVVKVFDQMHEILSCEYLIDVVPVEITDILVDVDTNLVIPIDHTLPDMNLGLVDKNGDNIPFVGKLQVLLKCPLLRFECDGMEDPEFLMEESDQGILPFSNQWKMFLRSPTQLLLDRNKVVKQKKITFTLEIFDTTHVETRQKVGPTKTFDLFVSPGLPSRLEFGNNSILNNSLKVQNDSLIDEIELLVYDEWGQRTAPELEEWTVELKSGPCHLNNAEPDITSTGKILLKRVLVTATSSSIPRSGVHQTQLISLSSKALKSPIVIELKLHISAQHANPSSLRLHRHREVLDISSPLTCLVGTRIDGLSFEILDEKGERVESDDGLFQCKSDGVICSWESSKTPKRKATSGTLPDLVLPEFSENSTLEFEVICTLKTFGQLSAIIVVDLVPGRAVKWFIRGASNLQEIWCGEQEDFKSLIASVALVDEYNNLAQVSVQEQLIVPIMNISWENEGGNVTTFPINLIQNTEAIGHHVFHLDTNFFLSSWPTPGSVAELSVSDGKNAYTPDTVDLPVLAGPPRATKVSCVSLGVAEPTFNSLISVNKFSIIDNIRFYLFDNCGNPANCKLVKGLLYTVSIEGSNERVFKNMKTKSNMVPVSFLFLSSSSSSSAVIEDEIQINCTVMFKKDQTDVKLLPVTIHCQYSLLNIVDQINISVLQQGGVSRDVSSLELNCESVMPSIQFSLSTENKQLFSPSVSSITVSLSYESPEKAGYKDIIDISEFFQPLALSEDTGVFTMMQNFTGSLQIGTYTLTVFYAEQRPQFAEQASKLGKSSTLVIQCTAGRATGVAPADEYTKRVTSGMFASNSTANKSSRTLASNVSFALVDIRGNKAPALPVGTDIVCCVRRPEESAADIDDHPTAQQQRQRRQLPLPRLVGADVDGYLRGTIDSHRSAAVFRNLEVVPDNDCASGLYDLVFMARTTDPQEMYAYAPFISKFELLSDQYQLEKINELKAQIARKQEALLPMDREYNETIEKIKRLEDQIKLWDRQIISRPPPSLATQERGALTQGEALSLEAQLLSQRNDIDSVGSARSVFIYPSNDHRYDLPNLTQLINIPHEGFVLNLGYVSDEQEARILSAAAYSYMTCLVVKESHIAKQLYERKIQCWSLDQIPKFTVNDRGKSRPRNELEMDMQKLPYPELHGPSNEPIRGNPRYMVNMIELPREQEHFRDSIFHGIYGRSLLFDDLDSAMNYRKFLVSRNQHAPDLWTCTGDRLRSNGVMNPRDKVDIHRKESKEVPYVFGAMDAKQSKQYQVIESDLKLLADIKVSNTELSRLKRRVHQLEQASGGVEELRKEVAALHVKLNILAPEMAEAAIPKKKRRLA